MQFPSQIICPYCLKEITATTTWCGICGRDLQGKRENPYEIPPKIELYKIIPDGELFGIALRGEIKIHGVEREVAESILVALNRSCELERLDNYLIPKSR
jgi:hypothetical protein